MRTEEACRRGRARIRERSPEGGSCPWLQNRPKALNDLFLTGAPQFSCGRGRACTEQLASSSLPQATGRWWAAPGKWGFGKYKGAAEPSFGNYKGAAELRLPLAITSEERERERRLGCSLVIAKGREQRKREVRRRWGGARSGGAVVRKGPPPPDVQ